jgi:hypothetical protein
MCRPGGPILRSWLKKPLEGVDIGLMRNPTGPTRAARIFRLVVIGGAVVICGAAFFPWCTINGLTYTFFDVDSWNGLPIAEFVVAAGAVIGSLFFVTRIKRIGLILGSTGLFANVVGAAVAARLANVHNSDQYFRVWAVMSIRPAWGGWLALTASLVVLVGAASRWSSHARQPVVAIDGAPLHDHFEGRAGRTMHVPLDGSRSADPDEEVRTGMPHFDEVIAPPVL